MFRLRSRGDFKKTQNFLTKMAKDDIFSQMDKYGMMGVAALSSATPVRTGETSESWYYETLIERGVHKIIWRNSHMAGAVPLVILLQYGHGTGTGGYVQGHDFINPAIQPIFDQISADLWKAVTSA